MKQAISWAARRSGASSGTRESSLPATAIGRMNPVPKAFRALRFLCWTDQMGDGVWIMPLTSGCLTDERGNLTIAEMVEMSNSGVWLQRMRPAEVRDDQGEDLFLVGLEAFVPWDSRVAAGHQVFDIGRGRLEGDAWYLIRRPDGKYDLRRIPARRGQAMVSTRSIAVSPFPTDPDAVYFAGFDANRTRVHDTAWIVRATLEAAIGGSD